MREADSLDCNHKQSVRNDLEITSSDRLLVEMLKQEWVACDVMLLLTDRRRHATDTEVVICGRLNYCLTVALRR